MRRQETVFEEEDLSRLRYERKYFFSGVLVFLTPAEKLWVNTYYVLKQHTIFLAFPPEMLEFVGPSSEARKIELSNSLSSTRNRAFKVKRDSNETALTYERHYVLTEL